MPEIINFLEPVRKPRDVSIDELVDNTFKVPTKEEFQELEDNDRKRNEIESNLTMAQGQRYNDGKHGRFNINKDVIPYDQTRVKLKTPINGIDYINASWIQRFTESNPYDDVYDYLQAAQINFLLTQDPTSDTEQHYYQMMYEQKVDIIVHVGSNKNLPQCNEVTYGNITKKLIKSIQLDQNVTRETFDIFVKHKKSTSNHPMTAYHFTSWPANDQFDERDSENFLKMISLIRRDIGKPTKEFTIVSHDSSGGVEGASSFIVLFQMLQDLETKLKVRKLELGIISKQREIEYINLFDKVNDIRKQRAKMISTYSNYKFLMSSLAYFAREKPIFDEILIVSEQASNEKTSFPNLSNQIENEANDESEYVYSDDIEAGHEVYVNDELIQGKSKNYLYYNEDIYIN